MQKAFVKKNPPWANYPDISTPIIAEELNRVETGIDTIDDRVVAFDTSKANQNDLLVTFKAVSFDTSTGVFTFTRWNDTTFTVDTDIEKIAVNFDYDDDPTSAHYQNLVLTLSDGTVKYVDLSALITQYEFSDTSTIAFTVSAGGGITANVVNGSITADKLQPNYLADVTTQANNASASATNAGNYKLDAEAWANGTRNGTAVASTDPAYHNNSKYWKDQAQQIASGSIGGLSDVDIDTPTLANKQVLTYNSTTQMWENKETEVTRLKSLDMVGKTTTFNADGSISVVADDYSEDVTFNDNGSITDEVTINNVKTTKTTHFMGNDIIEDLHDYQGCVDLGTFTWNKHPTLPLFYITEITDFKQETAPVGYIYFATGSYCTGYNMVKNRNFVNGTATLYYDSSILGYRLMVADNSKYSAMNASQFKSAMSGVYLTYETNTQ